MDIREHVPLAPFVTFRAGGSARYLVAVRDERDVFDALHFAREAGIPTAVLGGGSNTLPADGEIAKVVLHMKGDALRFEEVGADMLAIADAGLVMDTLVMESAARGLWGLENLSGIPGSVGAAPVQNVGAYGVEAGNVIAWVDIVDLANGTARRLDRDALRFEYRDSVFKHPEGRDLVVIRVAFQLTKRGMANTGYKDLVAYFGERTPTSPKEVRDAVLAIRAKKFPDLSVIGTAGSYFKNPILDAEHVGELLARYPELPHWVTPEAGKVKVSAAYLIDKIAGLRGVRVGDVGTWGEQALVIVNYGGANANAIEDFARDIVATVRAKCGVTLEPEVVKLS